MHHLSLTLDSPAENLALDEALLDAHEAGEIAGGVLRLWESPNYAVVLGRSSSANLEVNLDACRQNHIAVLRRCSGGGTVVAGPGCLMYAVVLDFDAYPQLRAVDLAHDFVLGRLTKALTPLLPNVAKAGTSDLILKQKINKHLAQKFSGNALRIKRNHLLYHGTLLYNFDLNQISRLLGSPTRQPEYRDGRSHGEFITNLPTSRENLEQVLISTWNATKLLTSWPRTRVTEIVQTKYAADAKWTIL
ncbi:MAG: lipoate--protein ligase family protein [Planctomycetes bacterium]|nr:lipoate--protein ligase family protein [Planctomycetota bacterium]